MEIKSLKCDICSRDALYEQYNNIDDRIYEKDFLIYNKKHLLPPVKVIKNKASYNSFHICLPCQRQIFEDIKYNLT